MDIKLTHKQADYYTSVFDLNGKVKSDDKTEFYFFGGHKLSLYSVANLGGCFCILDCELLPKFQLLVL